MNEQLDIEIEALKAENFSLRLEIERLKRAQSGPPAWEYQLERADNLDRKLTTAMGRLRREREKASDLVEALDRIWTYASIGASVSDVDTREQPQFVKVRALLAKHGRARP